MPTDDEQKRLIKEALHEWLDEKYALVGRWTINGLIAATVGALVTFILMFHGTPH